MKHSCRLLCISGLFFSAMMLCSAMENVSDTASNSGKYILAYTRKAVPRVYPDGLARSVHFACSDDGRTFTALNSNYGILFPEATLSARNTIQPKGVSHPVIFLMKDGSFGILGIRVNENGSEDVSSRGCLLVWKTKDFKDFEPSFLLRISEDKDVSIQNAVCSYNAGAAVYQIRWNASNGKTYLSELKELEPSASFTTKEDSAKLSFESSSKFVLPENSECAYPVALKLQQPIMDSAMLYWSKLKHIDNRLPQSVVAKSAADVEKIKAILVYSDGSTTTKSVKWDTSSVDFTKPGNYQVKGVIQNIQYKFPLDRSFGDPVFFKKDGLFHFIGTTDARNSIGFYTRHGKTIQDIFRKGNKEDLILDRDERRSLIQTFWAPEFHVIGGRLYMLFAVSGRGWGPQCHVMALKEGGHIQNAGDWEDPKRVQRMDGKWLAEDGISLDMTYIKGGKKSYLVWSYRKGIGSPNDTGSMLYIATIDEQTPWKLTSEPVLLTRPLFGWENTEGTINNEGPNGFVRNGKVYLTYSGGSAGGYTYAVGLLTANENDDLLKLSSWKKRPTPVLSFYSIEGEYGPGHNAFYTEDNGDFMISYHAEERLSGGPRSIGIHRIHFNLQGEPVFDMSADRDLAPSLANVEMTVKVQ